MSSLQPYPYPPPPPGYPQYPGYPPHAMYPYPYPPHYPPPPPGSHYPHPPPGYAYPPAGYPDPRHAQQHAQQQQHHAARQQKLQQIKQQQAERNGSDQGMPLSALALAAATGLHEMEKEKEQRDREVEGERVAVERQAGGSRPGSASSTPYGSYDAGGYWPAYASQHYAVAMVPGGPSQSQSGDEVKHPTSTSRSSRRHPHAPHPHLPHYPVTSHDDAASRHSHSHDASHPQHHTSLSRALQHRHSYAPYAYTASADHSLANSPTSSVSSDASDDEHHHPSTTGGKRRHKRRGVGAGVGSPPGHNQHHALSQLEKALKQNLVPSTSPVLGPLKGLTLMSAQPSRAPSRSGSRVHSRASSPIHLPPLKLPPSMERAANGVGIPGAGAGGSGSGSGNTSGRNSEFGSPDTGFGGVGIGMALAMGMSGAARHSQHVAFAGHSTSRGAHVRAHPYGASSRSQPGSPTYEERHNGGGPRGHSGLSPPPLGLSSSYPKQVTIHHQHGSMRDLLNGSDGVGLHHEPRTNNFTNSSAYFPVLNSGPSSRQGSPPASPGMDPSSSRSHFSSATNSNLGSTDSLVSLAQSHSGSNLSRHSGLRTGFGMTPISSFASPSTGGDGLQLPPLNLPKQEMDAPIAEAVRHSVVEVTMKSEEMDDVDQLMSD